LGGKETLQIKEEIPTIKGVGIIGFPTKRLPKFFQDLPEFFPKFKGVSLEGFG